MPCPPHSSALYSLEEHRAGVWLATHRHSLRNGQDTTRWRRDRPVVRRDLMLRVCSICTHVDRLAVDAALRAGTPLWTIATDWSVSKTALLRHRNTHMYSAPGAPSTAEPVGALT